MIRSGQLRERVTIQQPVRAADGGGGAAETWAAIDGTQPVHAMVRVMRRREEFEAQRNEAQITHTVVVRFRTDITNRHRLLWHARHGDVPLDVRTVTNPDMRGIWLELLCEEGVPT